MIPPEAELAVRFQISKAVVRESVRGLEAVGMLRVQHGKRTRVLESSEWNVLALVVQEAYLAEGLGETISEQLYEVRLILEPPATAWVVRRAPDRTRARLIELADAMDKVAVDSRSVREFLSIDRQFHGAIAVASGNAVLRAVLRDLHAVLLNWTYSKVAVEHLEPLAAQHQRIARAVARGDAAGASKAMASHLQFARQLESGSRLRSRGRPQRIGRRIGPVGAL